MSDQAGSPVEQPASHVAQGWRYMSGRQKGILLGTVAVVAVAGAMVWSTKRHAASLVPPPAQPVKQTGPGERFNPAPMPAVQKASLGIVTPVMPTAVPAPMVGNDAAKAARESDIMAQPPQATQRPGVQNVNAQAADGIGAERQSALGDRLQPTEMKPVRASETPNPDFLISPGRLIPCEQQTAIDTTFPGFVSATIPAAIKSDSGNVTLLDAGAKVVGQMDRAIINGLDRQFVLWHMIYTPVIYDRAGVGHKYRMPVNSPASDDVGATGLPGDVDRHLWQKIKGAALLTLLQGGIQAGIASVQQRGTTTLNLGGSLNGVENLGSQYLASTINIPDVLKRPQGSTCSIFVARELDFSGIYSLRRNASR